MSDWSSFTETNRQQWMLQASQDNKGKAEIHGFSYAVEGLGGISPFLTSEEAWFLPSVDIPPTFPGMHIVEQTDIRANEIALRMLEIGAACLWFDVSENWCPEVLLQGIYIDMVKVIFDGAEEGGEFITKLKRYIEHLPVKSMPEIIILGHDKHATHRKVHLKSTQDFAQRAEQIQSGFREEDGEKKPLFLHMDLKTDFFAQVAELRFIQQIIQGHKMAGSVFIAATTTAVPEEWREIHPLIPATYQLLSAHLGMAHVAFGINSSFGEELARISLNSQHIMQEEGKTGMVSDPLAGAYLTDQILKLLENSK